MKRTLLFSVSIRDCRVEALASTPGAGGQHKNRRHTAIRITHPPSNAVGYSADERSQLQNKEAAFKRMINTKEFKNWHRIECARRMGAKSVDQLVEEAMQPQHIRVETLNEKSQWIPMSETV